MGEIPRYYPESEPIQNTQSQISQSELEKAKIFGPSPEEAAELNTLSFSTNENDKLLSPESKIRNFVNASIEIAINFAKRPSKKAKIAIGLFTFLAGLGTWKRDEILDWGAREFMQNSYVMGYFDSHLSQDFKIPSEKKVDDINIQPSEVNKETASVEFKGNKINLIGSFESLRESGSNIDFGNKIPIENYYLKNLLQPDYEHVEKASDPQKFHDFVKEQNKKYFASGRGRYIKADFNKGDIQAFLEVAQVVLENNLSYDKKTESWLKEDDDGRLSLRWSKANPISSYYSTDGTPVDKLLMEKHVGVCRQYSDAMCLVVDEMKTLYPDKFQNVYVTSFHDAYQWHFYNLVFVAKSPNEVDCFAMEPQSRAGNAFVPAYEFLKTLRDRDILTPDKYLDAMKQFMTLDNVRESENEIFSVIDYARERNRSDVIDAAKEYFIKNGELESIEYLCDEGLANDKDYTEAGVKYFTASGHIYDTKVKELVEKARKISPESYKQITAVVRQVLLHPDFEKMATMNYQDMVEDYRDQKVLTEKEYFLAMENFYRQMEYYSADKKYVDFLLSKPEYYPFANDHLMKSLQYTVDSPRWIMEGFIKGEYAGWSRKEAWEQANIDRWEVINRYSKQLDRYRELTGHDLIKETESEFRTELAKLKTYLDSNPKHEKGSYVVK